MRKTFPFPFTIHIHISRHLKYNHWSAKGYVKRRTWLEWALSMVSAFKCTCLMCPWTVPPVWRCWKWSFGQLCNTMPRTSSTDWFHQGYSYAFFAHNHFCHVITALQTGRTSENELSRRKANTIRAGPLTARASCDWWPWANLDGSSVRGQPMTIFSFFAIETWEALELYVQMVSILLSGGEES